MNEYSTTTLNDFKECLRIILKTYTLLGPPGLDFTAVSKSDQRKVHVKLFEIKGENEENRSEVDKLEYFYKQIKKQSEGEVVGLMSCFAEGKVCAVITERADDFVSLEAWKFQRRTVQESEPGAEF